MGLPETFGFFSARNAIIEGQYPHLEEKNKTTTKQKSLQIYFYQSVCLRNTQENHKSLHQ